MRLDFNRASTSSAVVLSRGPNPCSARFFGGGERTGGRIELDQRFVGGLGFHLPLTKTPQSALRLRQRGFIGACRLDAAAAKRAHRFRGTGDAAAAVELGDAGLRACDVPLQPDDLGREQRACRQRRVAIGLQARDGFCGIVGEILAAAVERRDRARLEIGDAGDGRLELATFLLVLRDRQRQGPFAALEGGGGVAHLLIEDQKGRPVFQLLARGGHAAAEKCHYGLEHLKLPVMSVAHR
jgi:hypothetical protein